MHACLRGKSTAQARLCSAQFTEGCACVFACAYAASMAHLLSLLVLFAEANAIRRFRLAFIGLLTISAVLHIFSTNATLNLQDAKPTSTLITHTEHLRARIVSGSFAFGAAFTIALIAVLGEDDAKLGDGSELDAQQPLLQPGDV